MIFGSVKDATNDLADTETQKKGRGPFVPLKECFCSYQANFCPLTNTMMGKGVGGGAVRW